jgi:hypothetical protein
MFNLCHAPISTCSRMPERCVREEIDDSQEPKFRWMRNVRRDAEGKAITEGTGHWCGELIGNHSFGRHAAACLQRHGTKAAASRWRIGEESAKRAQEAETEAKQTGERMTLDRFFQRGPGGVPRPVGPPSSVRDGVRAVAAPPLPRIRHVEDEKQITHSLSRLRAAYIEFAVQD